MKPFLAAFFCCLGLLAAGCDDKPRPGGPTPKASAAPSAAAPLAG